MSKSKLIVITGAILVIVVMITIVLVIARSKKTVPPSNTSPANEIPLTFTISVDQQNRSYTGTITANGSTKVIDEPELLKYAVVSFNSPIDIMWVSCVDGYAAQNPHSATGNSVVTDPNIGPSIELFANRSNNLSLTCVKK